MLREKNNNPVLSYMQLRRLIGILGMLLPLVCYAGGAVFGTLPLQKSISFYYYTNVRDVFVGLLIAVGMFLCTYNGYELIDKLVSHITGFAAVGIAVFPCASTYSPVGFFQLNAKLSNIIHIVCAVIFFLLLAVNSIWIFTLTKNKATMTDNKKKRNVIYITCGAVILCCLALLVILNMTLDSARVSSMRLVFIFETVMLEAFGVSWLVKGEAILHD